MEKWEEVWREKMAASRAKWGDKIKVIARHSGYAHNLITVEIEGDEDPPATDLVNAADRYNYNFGGDVQRRWTEDGKKYACVKVYID